MSADRMSKTFQPRGNSFNARTVRARRKKIYEETDGRCFYCGCQVEEFGQKNDRNWLILKDNNMVVEHKTPIIRGGPNTRENIVCACRDCNARKGAFTVNEFRLLSALRCGDLNFRFAGELPEPIERDWLICHSAAQEQELLVFNIPAAAEAYSLRRNAHARSKTWRPIGARG